MRWASVLFATSTALLLLLLTPTVTWAATAEPAVTCEQVVEEQDGVIGELDKEVAELRLALADRKAEVERLRAAADALTREADSYKKLWLAEAEAAAAERKRAAWSERFAVLRYSVLGFGVGVIADRWAAP